ncbi:MAG: DNA repair protein RecN [Bacteroidales bacterium]|nr:DNA repair protein RecN [Bacteroidales bacterium]
MLRRLLIENYALIDHLDIVFPDDLVIITGETGAGKSILLGALSLALGGRSDMSVLQDRSRNCVVEAVFEEDGREVPFRRVITPQGRSRSFIDDEPAGLEQLREAASRLVDIHSQHQQLLLAEKGFQQRVLDFYAGISADVEAYGRLWQEWVEAGKALEELDARIAASRRDRDYLEFQFAQLEEAALKEGELEELEEEQGRLAHGEAVKEQVARVEQLFEEGGLSLEARLKEMASALDRVVPFYPEFGSLRDRLDSARIELKDVHDEISFRGERISFSPERLAEVDARLALLYGLLRKFDVSTVTDLISLRDTVAARLGAAVDDELGRERLQKQVVSLQAACEHSAEALHAARVQAAPGLSALLQEQVRSLEMPLARFSVKVTERPAPGPDGKDEVSFLFDANDRGLQPLAKCASGGELSRIMLCIKSLLAHYKGMPTLIFDEIDTGISGSVAEKMGQMIAGMGERMQLFAITHLPQVASKGASHYLVYKEAGPDGARTGIRRIDGPERVREIARMLSGENITPEALANAGVLLQGNKSKTTDICA